MPRDIFRQCLLFVIPAADFVEGSGQRHVVHYRAQSGSYFLRPSDRLNGDVN